MKFQSSLMCITLTPKDAEHFFLFYFVGRDVLTVCVPVYHLHAWCPQRPEEGTGSHGLQLQMCVSCHGGARNRTWVL